MNVSIRQLEVFVHVYRTGNISRAAAQLGLSQSAVSLHLKQLEAVLGLKLFDRTTRAVHPTIAATQAVAASERVIVASQSLVTFFREFGNASIGKVELVTTAGFAATFMPPIIASFRKANPGVRLVVHDVPSNQLVDKLLSTEAEFGVGSSERHHPDVLTEPILRESRPRSPSAKARWRRKNQFRGTNWTPSRQ